ncbi:MAG: MarR family winged helix-turn-helix transcriptional regulator [Acidimicrobiales bacterium]
MPADLDAAARLRFATMRLARLLRQHADPDGLSQSLLSALATLNRVGPITLGQLADLERVQPPSMTRIVAQLEERQLVARETDATDRRVARVRVLPAAERLLAEVRTRKTEYLGARLADLTPGERAALMAALPALERLAEVSP